MDNCENLRISPFLYSNIKKNVCSRRFIINIGGTKDIKLRTIQGVRQDARAFQNKPWH